MYAHVSKQTIFAFIILKIFVFCILALVFIQFTVDDAYISFRYAHNYINYGVWNYNPSSVELVEAYTNPVYTVVNILPETLNISSALFFKFIGLTLLVVLFYLVERQTSSRLAGFFLIANPAFYVHGLSGLETLFFVFISFLTLSVLMKPALTTKNQIIVTALGILLPLIRPEGALFAVVVAGVLILKRKFLSVILLLICWLLYYIIRFSYFDAMLPNTFYIKSGNSLNTIQVLNNYKVMVIDFVILGLIFYVNYNHIVRLACALGLLTLNYYCFSDLQMNYVHRFGFQITMIMILLHVTTINLSWKSWANRLILFLLVVYSCLMFRYSHGLINQQYSNNIVSLQSIGCELRKINQHGVMVMGDAGTLPYWSNWDVIDSIGLANREIGRFGALKESYLAEKNPSIIILYDFYDTPAKDFERLAEFNNLTVVEYLENNYENFQDAGRFYWMDNYSYLFYLNRQDETYEQIIESLTPHFEDSLENLTVGSTDMASILSLQHILDELNAPDCGWYR